AAELRRDREVLWLQHLPAKASRLAVLLARADAAHREAVTADAQLAGADRRVAGAPGATVELALEARLAAADGEAELGAGRCRELFWVHGDLGLEQRGDSLAPLRLGSGARDGAVLLGGGVGDGAEADDSGQQGDQRPTRSAHDPDASCVLVAGQVQRQRR